jgi:hypothetical protein
MYFSDLLPQIDPKWHEAFVRFIETGEASQGFLTYLNSDHGCQKAMERLLAAHVKTLKPFMQAATATPTSKRGKAAAAAAPKPRRTRRRAANGRHAHTSART